MLEKIFVKLFLIFLKKILSKILKYVFIKILIYILKNIKINFIFLHIKFKTYFFTIILIKKVEDFPQTGIRAVVLTSWKLS